ncbi:MAG: 5'-nucleotidase C-terminal domain-containing protein [Pseudomonadota bacterium]
MLKHLPLVALAAAMLSACEDTETEVIAIPVTEEVEVQVPVEVEVPERVPLSMTIAHVNDHHSNLDEIGGFGALTFDVGGGQEVDFNYGSFPRVVSKIKDIRNDKDNVLKLHAGDAITGDLYYIAFDGEADADMMNLVCFDAFALGNHEFDDGDAGLANFLGFLADGFCNTPVLGANVQTDASSPIAGLFQASTIKEIGGQEVGIVGLVAAQKTKNSSNPDETTVFEDEATAAQREIDALTAAGVDKIVLLTHIGYDNDLALASTLTGVDVIVGGDSHTLLGADFETLGGLNPQGDYPTITQDAAGNTVCVVQAFQFSAVVGELDVEFDEDGNVTACSGTPHLLLSDEIDPASFMSATTFVEANDSLSFVSPDPEAAVLLELFDSQVDAEFSEVIGAATEDLCFERVPGQGRSSLVGCEPEVTIVNGGDVPQLVAQVYREIVRDLDGNTADISIQNSGGVRTDLPEGDLTLGDAFNLLPFDNTMVILTMTGAEVAAVIEEAVADGFGSSGAYPYASGLRWDADLNQPAGSRMTNFEVRALGETDWTAIDPAATYTVVTNSFAAAGGDGYDTFETVSDDGRAFDTQTRYVDPFVDFLEINGTISKPPVDSFSTRSFVPEVTAG